MKSSVKGRDFSKKIIVEVKIIYKMGTMPKICTFRGQIQVLQDLIDIITKKPRKVLSKITFKHFNNISKSMLIS